MNFLGRKFDVNRNGWAFTDGSGFLPDEMRIDVMNEADGRFASGARALGIKYEWEYRLNKIRSDAESGKNK